MNTYSQIDRSLVAIFYIEAFSVRNSEQQAQLVQKFLDFLAKHLEELNELMPDAFSTGDGAIVSIGRKCSLDVNATKAFLSFTIAFTATLCDSGVTVRAAVNYSEGDRIVFGTGNTLKGQYIQVGDTINIASKIVAFCEPRELMISKNVHNLLLHHELLEEFNFYHNDPLITKLGLQLDTYTFSPLNELSKKFYSPNSPLHPYKRFSSFPPIKAETFRYFMSSGLESELRKTVSNAYDAMRFVNETKTFLTSNEVLQVLTRPNYDPDDIVYVVSRNDRPSGFWTQKRRSQYISFLNGNANRYGGTINQKRVMVFDEDKDLNELMPPDDIFYDLKRLHSHNTFYNFRSSLLYPYERISDLIFGFTLSTKHRYAIIPIPGTDIDAYKLRTKHFGELLRQYQGYDATDGPMKAIITADKTYVSTLIAEFENLVRDPTAEVIK